MKKETGILQARILEWVAISFSRGSSRPRDRTWVSCIAGRLFTTEPGVLLIGHMTELSSEITFYLRNFPA